MSEVEVLIPTYERVGGVGVTLMGLYYQEFGDFSIMVADQAKEPVSENQVVKAVGRLHEQVREVRWLRNPYRRGLAENRQRLLEASEAEHVLFLDDDVVLEPWVLRHLVRVIKEEKCGLVGMGLVGLSYLDDVREDEQAVEFWEGRVEPEVIRPGGKKWERYKLHNAANLRHVAEKLKLTPDEPKLYKLAWAGGCVLYDRSKLVEVGGFEFWDQLPVEHAGEDVLVQLRVMERFGGCGVLPSGAYHMELETTVSERGVNAVEVFWDD